jgi:hypothetical protein
MKKLLYLAGAALLMGSVAACEDEAENPGDYNLKAELELDSVIYGSSGNRYRIVIDSVRDSVYRYSYTVKDTLRDSNGDFVIGADGGLTVTTDTLYYNSKRTATVYYVHQLDLDYIADTLYLDINSNARWLASVPSDATKSTQWYFNWNSSTAGGGDSRFEFRVSRNFRSRDRDYAVHQEILTSDSTVMYIIPMLQKAKS